MITSILALFFLFLLSAGLSGRTGRRMEDCLPLSVCVTIVWLYCFYCAQNIWLGVLLYCVLSAILFLTTWKNHAKAKKESGFLKGLITPGFAAYLGMCTLFLLVFSGNIVRLVDELRLWGAVPKAMHVLGTLQLGESSPIFSEMQSYPPGLPLWGFFFTAFSKDFSEGALFVAYTCGTMTFFLPAFSKWEWKDWWKVIPSILIVYAVPFVFTSHIGDDCMFGMSLFVDPLLGVTAGYAFFLAVQKPFQNRFELARFCLILMILPLLKSTGMVFALCALACALILGKERICWIMLLPVVSIAAGMGSWNLLLSYYDVHEFISVQMHLLNQEEISNLLHALVSINMVAYKVPVGPLLSFASIYTILGFVFGITTVCCHKHESKKEMTAGLCILLSTLVFVYGYAVIYAKTLSSFPRYMQTPILCLTTYLILREWPLCPGERIKKWLNQVNPRIYKAVACLCVVLAVGVTVVWKGIVPEYQVDEMAEKDVQIIRQTVLEAGTVQGTTQIFLVMAGHAGDNSAYHHRMFLTMLSEQMNLCNERFRTRVIGPEVEDPVNTWAEELRGDVDYVYVYSVEEAFVPVFLEFSEDPPQAGMIYRVMPSENVHGIQLIPAEQA